MRHTFIFFTSRGGIGWTRGPLVTILTFLLKKTNKFDLVKSTLSLSYGKRGIKVITDRRRREGR